MPARAAVRQSRSYVCGAGQAARSWSVSPLRRRRCPAAELWVPAQGSGAAAYTASTTVLICTGLHTGCRIEAPTHLELEFGLGADNA
jgi:hypothetical protein